MVKDVQPSLEDLIGIEHCKLGFFEELRQKLKELKSANTESEQRRQEIAAILDGITDLMMVLSEDLRIISVNRVFHKILGIDNPEGRYCYEIFRDETHPCPECPAHRSFRTNTVCRETAIFSIGDRNMQFEMVASPILTPDKSERRILIFKRDVTMEKEYQAKFYQAEKMATIGQLAAGVAHEVNNPLTAISGFAEGIQRRLAKVDPETGLPDLEDIGDYAATIVKECRRCQSIVQALLTFSRPKSSPFSPVDINVVVSDTLKLLSNILRIKERRIDLRLELCDDLPLIYGDESHLKQIMLNLLVNARDSIEEADRDGTIAIRTSRQGADVVCLAVEDTGCGIPAENMGKLFEPFFTTKHVGRGSGIGLSTCYGIVKEHCGEILVSSQVGTGSHFLVKLPVNPERQREHSV